MTYAPVSRYGGRPLEGLSMQKIDPAFLFELSTAMRAIREVDRNTPAAYGAFILDHGKAQIQQAIDQSVYSHLFRGPVRQAGNTLLAIIDELCSRVSNGEDTPFGLVEIARLSSAYAKFETLFLGDLQASALYLVLPKGAYDTDRLTEAGETVFSSELVAKVPAAVEDLKQATRCLAFELPTAAGFHLHRAHESVLRVYWDCVTGGAPRPEERNMGVYLRELNKLGKGREAVRLHLKSIKDFHRNPLMHPEQSLESVDQALDLLAAIRCSIGYMLQEVPGLAAPLLEQLVKDAEDAGLEVHQG